MDIKFTPQYKDNQCTQQNAYGCKDQYGVSYPIWYKNEIEIKTVNTDVPEHIREKIEPYMRNVAESVYMYPQRRNSQSDSSYKFDMLVRPNEQKVRRLVSLFLYSVCCLVLSMIIMPLALKQ